MNKGKNIGRFVLWVFAVMVLCFAIVGSIIGANIEMFIEKIGDADSIYEGLAKNSTEIDYEDSADLSGINKIVIKDKKSDVFVRVTEDDDIKVNLRGSVYIADSKNYPDLDVRNKGDELAIKVTWPKTGLFWFFPFFDKTTLEIHVPKDYMGNMTIDVVSSNVYAEMLVMNEVEIESVSGRVEVVDCSFDELIISTVSGRIKAEGEFGNTELESVSGIIELVSNKVKGDIDISTTSGNIILYIPFDVEGFSVEYGSVSGRFSNEYNGIDIQRSENNKFLGNYGNSRYIINFDSVSGNARIVKSNK